MSDNEYESFEITDYDLKNEFNINRPRVRQSKNQQIYGIWADDSDNENSHESRRSGRRGKSNAGSNNKTKDYTAPVSFVAGGIQQAGKNKKKDEKNHSITDGENRENPITDEEEYEDLDSRSPADRQRLASGSTDVSSEEEISMTSRHQSNTSNLFPRIGLGGSAINNSSSNSTDSKSMGAWQQHTRGIGAKLLLQMGYKPGKGLGKDLQGIAQPVQAHVRKGRGAIGAYGPETAASVGGKTPKPKEDEDEREVKEFHEKLNKWKKDGKSAEDSLNRYYYKSVEEVIEKGKKINLQLPEKISKQLKNVPVIDMTGPEKRVLSGYHALAQSKVMDEDLYELESSCGTSTIKSTTQHLNSQFSLPELLHNLNMIVNMCEQDIIALDKAEREANERQIACDHEKKNIEELVRLETAHIQTLEGALELVDELIGANNLTLDRSEEIFVKLQNTYSAEYKEYGLGDLAAGVLAPLVKDLLQDWQPLEKPTQPVALIKKWRIILENGAHVAQTENRNVFDPYSSLIWAGVIPSFRTCAVTWNPKQYQIMVGLLNCWAPLFPTWILDSVLEQLILPRLVNGVREWDPRTDTVPIHLWILPWNAILGHKMEEFIFPTIRDKLAVALKEWTPRDRSARAMLTPWQGTFESGAMHAFLIKHIVPKLQITLSELVVNPLQQDLELWNQVWEWNELLPIHLMAQLLDKFFFPKWMQVLAIWLNQAPDYAEISRWYTGWKSLLSEEMLRDPTIKEHLRRALEMMHRATDQLPITPPLGMTMGALPSLRALTPPPPPPPTFLDVQIATPSQLEFKELLSQKCSERGIIFAPIPGKREMGKQIYRVGKLFCYIDRNVCMLSDSSFKSWSPKSINQMLERAVTGVV